MLSPINAFHIASYIFGYGSFTEGYTLRIFSKYDPSNLVSALEKYQPHSVMVFPKVKLPTSF